MTAPPDVRYPRAVDQLPAPAPEAGGTPRWITVLADSLGLVLVVWSLPVAIVIVALPIAFVAFLITRFS